MDAQTQLLAELYKTLNDAQKQEVCNMIDTLLKYSLQGTTQSNGLTGGVPPVRFSM